MILHAGVVTSSSTKHLTSEVAFVKRPIQKRNIYRGGGKHNRGSLRTLDHNNLPTAVHYDSSGVVTSSLTAKCLTSEDVFVKRPIRRRNVYKGGDKRNRDSLHVECHTLDHNDLPDTQLIAKSAPGSGRTSPTDLLSFSLTAPKAHAPSSMSTPPIEAKVVILGAQG